MSNKASFITGFHVHPYHTVNYLHMHVICNNENMISKKNFKEQTKVAKFIRVGDIISTNKNNRNVKMLNNFNNK